jgi:hypothetical protein
MAKRQSRKPAAAARKKTAKRPAARKTARKAASKTARKTARKATSKTARKTARKAASKTARKAAPRGRTTSASGSRARKATPRRTRPAPEAPRSELVEVETTSAGIQPLAPEHAPVDDLTSTGNELLDIFQRYDRNRTGYIEAAELARLLEALGHDLSEEELMIAVDIIDTGRTGKISWREFKNWWNSR